MVSLISMIKMTTDCISF